MRDLLDEDLSAPSWIIQDLVLEGLIGYVGASKIGISWLMDGICISVVTGEKLPGVFEVDPWVKVTECYQFIRGKVVIEEELHSALSTKQVGPFFPRMQ